MKCAGCGLLFVKNRPDDDQISQAHKQGKHGGVNTFDMTGNFDNSKISKYLNILDDMFKGNLGNKTTWLDIGCGHGEFIMAVQKYSYGKITATGTEPNIKKQGSARRRGLNVGYFDIDSHSEKYDVVSMLNVYSHLPNPPSFIRSARKLLKKGGELILETGDTANFSAADHYKPFFLPDHLSFASEKIVVNILERMDFEILSVQKYPLIGCGLGTIAKELIKALLPKHKSRIWSCFRQKMYSKADMFIRSGLKD
ncbi:MAG: class I SAM-dependent methyltransferase [Candidatus Omnitrophota bacterium]